MKIKELIKKIFFEWEWLCAYRKIDDKTTLPNENEKYYYTTIRLPKKFWAADPFVFEYNGSVDIFFEYYSTKKRKAVLGHKNLFSNSSDVNIIYEFSTHCSYPCIFEYKNNLYILPETKAENKLILLMCKEYPNKWEQKCILLSNIKFVDSTPFFLGDELYVFLYEEINANQNILYIGKLDIEAEKVYDIEKVKEYNNKLGRPAGNILNFHRKQIRVTQPGINHYGEKILFDEFSYVDGKYVEKNVCELQPSQIKLDVKEKIIGVHTFNRTNSVEIVDVLTYGHFSFLRPFKYILCKLGFFGYNDLDKKKKIMYVEFKKNKKKEGNKDEA